ncbi:MAG: carboxypeptidase regulatory-like domain-containing protein [Myxococcota bacterium]
MRDVGVMVLFYWDGATDLVQDADLLMWGDDGPRVDKTGVLIDGPDEGEEPSEYAAETAPAEQSPAPAPSEGQALIRSGGEADEVTGGNGIDGVDETSEDLATAVVAEAPSLQPLFTLTGTVRDASSGDPVANTEVVLTGTELATVTDDQGVYTLADAPPGTYRITANAAGFASFAQTVEVVADQTVDIALDLQPQVTLTVRVNTSQATSDDAEVVVADDANQPVATVTAVDGVALFEGLPANNYHVQVTLRNFRPLDLGPIPLQADATLSLLLVSLEREPDVILTRTNGCALASLGGSGQAPYIPMAVVGLWLLLTAAVQRRRWAL